MDATDYISMISRLIVGGVFLFSGISKVLDKNSIANHIFDYQLLSPTASALMSPVIVILEIVLASLLIVGFAIQEDSLIAALLLISFSLGIAINLKRGRIIDCHCFGKIKEPISSTLILRNLLIIGLLCIIILTSSTMIWAGGQWQEYIRSLQGTREILPLLSVVALSWCALFLLGELGRILRYLSSGRKLG